MTNVRPIKRVRKSEPTMEGAGVALKRVFMYQNTPELDPFLLMDDFHSSDPDKYLKGFPWHPHRGIETISYMLHGEIEHGDSMGNTGIISAGDAQWMTAGSGIVHQEMPHGEVGGLMWGFQLWANLPAANKMMYPRYQEVKADQIPVAMLDDGVKVRVICGEIAGITGPVRDIVTDPGYLDVSMPASSHFSHMITPGYTAFAYVIEGAGTFGVVDGTIPRIIDAETVVIFGDGDKVQASAGDKSLRFLLLYGKPIREPVAWYGPIVMNTREELRLAFEEYQNGTFLKHR